MNSAQRRRFFERRLHLQAVDIDVTRFGHGERVNFVGGNGTFIAVPQQPMHLSKRDQAILVLLDRTPATAAHLLQLNATYPDGPFRDERRVRERMQTLAQAKLVRDFSLAVTGGGLANYYRLSPDGFRLLHGHDVPLPHRSQFSELPPSRIMHSLALADVIVHLVAAAHTARVRISQFHRENELVLEIGTHRVAPDCHFQFLAAGRMFNVLIELDRSTESVDSAIETSIRTKLLAYEAYQDYVWGVWKSSGEKKQRPYFRVVFLTLSAERALHILSLAKTCARNPDRRLCYAATLDEVLAADRALHAPHFIDHHGQWQSLINLHPSAAFVRTPVRIIPHVQPTLFV